MPKKMGRPKVENSNTIVKSVKMNKELIYKIDSYAKLNNLTFGEVVRLALEKFLSK